MKKQFLFLFTSLSLLSCNSEKNKLVNTEVAYAGALKTIMHKGDISAKAKLSDFKTVENFYALGALEDLKGEIQIFRSEPSNTIVVDSTLHFDNSFSKNATLLVYATVDKWNSFEIPDSIRSYEELEDFVSQTANANKINIENPFPFLIEGEFSNIDWHVINWKEGDMEHSHSKHINSGLNGSLSNEKAEMLGFYSNAHHAIFTHHTTNMHIHMKTKNQKIAGHVDGLKLGKGMILKLPAI